MADLTTLKIEVDTTTIERATAALDALAESAAKAKAALDALTSPGSTRQEFDRVRALVAQRAREVILLESRPGGLLGPR